jgi:methyl-accepting chemotaxis protein
MKNVTINIRNKIMIAVVAPLIGMISFACLDVLDQRATLTEDRKIHVRQMVEAAVSIVEHYHALADKGQLTDAEARERAKADIRDIRYGKGDFLFVYRGDGVTEVLGTVLQLEGKQRIATTDPNGVPYVRLLIENAKSDHGFVAYSFPRSADDHDDPRKISTSIYYEPWDWVVASGVYIGDIDEAFQSKLTRIAVILMLSISAIVVFSMVMVRTITRPLSMITGLMERLAEGDREISVPYIGKRDEVGKLARALDIFRRQAIALERQTEEQRQAEVRNAELLAAERRSIAGNFEARVMDLITGSFASSSDMHGTAKSMSNVANEALSQASSAAAAAAEATSNVHTVAAASEELCVSISDISRQVAESARMSTEAAKETQRINVMMADLSSAAGRIGEVVKLVNDIASQTNLLALNATIEAARAGVAGKGFAVVAGEVKTLATQTAGATGEITTQIGAVQAETGRAVQAIRNIGMVIEQVSQISSGIASAVEQQGAATQEISRSVSQAAAGTSQVSVNISGLTQAAAATETVAKKVLTVAGDQASYAERLRSEINGFLVQMRA